MKISGLFLTKHSRGGYVVLDIEDDERDRAEKDYC